MLIHLKNNFIHIPSLIWCLKSTFLFQNISTYKFLILIPIWKNLLIENKIHFLRPIIRIFTIKFLVKIFKIWISNGFLLGIYGLSSYLKVSQFCAIFQYGIGPKVIARDAGCCGRYKLVFWIGAHKHVTKLFIHVWLLCRPNNEPPSLK